MCRLNMAERQNALNSQVVCIDRLSCEESHYHKKFPIRLNS